MHLQDTQLVTETKPLTSRICLRCSRPIGQSAACVICRGYREDQRRARVQEAREHIRSARREMAHLDVSIQCHRAAADNADWDQPNRATDAMDALDRALEQLAGVER